MTRDQFVAALRTALMQLDDFNNLRHSPLLPLLCTEDTPGPVAFQQRLVASIQQLRHTPGATSRRYYEVLRYRYVEHLSQSEIAFQQGISERQLRRDQANAIELLGEQLWQQIDAAHRQQLAFDRADSLAPATEAGDIHMEMAWLKRQFPADCSQIADELQKAIADAEALAAECGVEISVEVPETISTVAIPPVALRQALLTVLTTLIANCAGARLSGRVQEEGTDIVIIVECQRVAPEGEEDRELFAHLHIVEELIQPFGAAMLVQHAHPLTVKMRFPTLYSVPVLVVDDNPDTSHLFHRYAANSRFHLIAVQDGRTAVELACRHQAAAVVLDIMMADVDGWDVLAQLRHHPTTQHIPVAICTILPQRDLSRVLGATLFLQKPVSQDDFLRALVELTAWWGPESG